MHLREATPINLPRLTELYTTSLTNDLFFNYKHPYRRQYPVDIQFLSQLMLKRYLYDKTTIVVAVMEEQDIAISDRGSQEEDVNRVLAKLEARSISHQHKRCDIDFARLAALEASLKVDHVQCFDILDWWYLSRLAVDSQFKDRGAETLLVQMGTLEADAESP
ncbi:hypothetical protein OEA41_002693 [Lepraria neglecta]|uniref:Uncharacterized protein n=1 Tax=Lepraria neglecta TaxID=209136 RepID=A0AAD9Z5Q1_9LECA|nr:hypothetical protein OEA41_002693 [Lepraria neglecta]